MNALLSLFALMAFLARDPTNLTPYNKFNYVCSDFAADLVHSANLQGFEAREVTIYFTHEIGHAIVVFETDKGPVYVEPQTDALYSIVEIGQPLCNPDWCVGNGEAVRRIIIEEKKAGYPNDLL